MFRRRRSESIPEACRLLLPLALLFGCAAQSEAPADAAAVAAKDTPSEERFSFALPPDFPEPPVPRDNPMSAAKVELGRHLFYDVRLSENETFSCATCHKQELAFTDGRARGLGATGELHPRGAPTLANVAYAQTLTAANPRMLELEHHVRIPIFGEHPVEMGQTSTRAFEARLRGLPRYAELFGAAFPDEPQPIVANNVFRALAAFQRTLISGDSAYDRYRRGERAALSPAAERGMRLVTTDEDARFACSRCHGGPLFSDHVTGPPRSAEDDVPPYHQTGLYDLDGRGGYPAHDTGLLAATGAAEDMGKFKAPTLRNIALTAPYMHDGSIATLDAVLDHYAQGGRARVEGVTDPLLAPFAISAEEKADVIAFLESLTDEAFVADPRFADPWPSLSTAESR